MIFLKIPKINTKEAEDGFFLKKTVKRQTSFGTLNVNSIQWENW